MVSKAVTLKASDFFIVMYLGIELFLSDFEPEHWLFFKGNEFWKDVLSYEGIYQVSTKGRVKRLKANKLLRFTCNKKGYYMTFLYKANCKRWNVLVHRLVALTFITNPLGKPQVNHIKGKNNYFKNLEWATCKENIHHAINTGLRDRNINLRAQDLFGVEDLKNIRSMFSQGLKNTEIAVKYNCVHSTISKIRTGTNYSNI